jgi:hypothetical protein
MEMHPEIKPQDGKSTGMLKDNMNLIKEKAMTDIPIRITKTRIPDLKEDGVGAEGTIKSVNGFEVLHLVELHLRLRVMPMLISLIGRIIVWLNRSLAGGLGSIMDL